ncbi:MAG: SDR family NAD(P)-dependent oxidoreductase, partial [Candidatus Latescibacterota bacterium]|nr:SDR family NAD(P)-dependent oxidoreductase [Candidatus Latescibacterota bacterium]
MNSQPLQNRIAVVTGAAQGIGNAIARRLASEGAHVAIVDIDGAAATRAAAQIGSGTLAVEADVSREEEVDRAFSKVIEEFGRLDILVNNAGI